MALAVRCMRGGFPDVCCETAIGCYSNRGATSNSCKEVGPAEPFAIRAKTRQSVQWGVWQHVVTLAARQSADCHDKRKIVQRSLSLDFFRQRAAGATSWRNLSPGLITHEHPCSRNTWCPRPQSSLNHGYSSFDRFSFLVVVIVTSRVTCVENLCEKSWRRWPFGQK